MKPVYTHQYHGIQVASLILAMLLGCFQAKAGELEEINVMPSPAEQKVLSLSPNESVIDTDASPKGALAAILVRIKETQTMRWWNFVDNKITLSQNIPTDQKITAIAFHPQGQYLYAIEQQGQKWLIVRQSVAASSWQPEILYSSNVQLRRPVFSTQRFTPSYLPSSNKVNEYRLYFGSLVAPGKWETISMREKGGGLYTLAGPAPKVILDKDFGEHARQFKVDSAVPASFHRSGMKVLMQNDKGCYLELNHYNDDWLEPLPLLWKTQPVCGNSVLYTANGLGTLTWRKGVAGLMFHAQFDNNFQEIILGGGSSFVSTPSSTADGKGVIGVVISDGVQQLKYMPLDVPMGEVLNAWLFVNTVEDFPLYHQHAGLLRPQRFNNYQLYHLYDEEKYSSCLETKRPFMVTTDIFWENFGAAFEAAYILTERNQAIPEFKKLINYTHRYFVEKNIHNRLSTVFSVAARILDNKSPASKEVIEEASLVAAGSSSAVARLLGESQKTQDVRYVQFKPRGHYADQDAKGKSGEMGTYFSAVRYLSLIKLTDEEKALIASLPNPAQLFAKSWINAYRPYIAPPRAPLAWTSVNIPLATHLHNPLKESRLFPLSWARDNEIFYNSTDPADGKLERLGPEFRSLPSGLDLAYVFGSDFAKTALADELTKYPRLASRLEKLRKELGSESAGGDTLYDSWLNGLAKQWDTKTSIATSPNVAALDTKSQQLWSAKRVETGLAFWATQRHTTILFNDQAGGAEGGEGGFTFEYLVLPPPRGYVEPDPETFRVIEDLYKKLHKTMTSSVATWPNSKIVQDEAQGIIKQMEAFRDVVGKIRVMSDKLLKHDTLTDKEYQLIENIGGAVEHNFLLMKSVQNTGDGLSHTDPMAKIADVAQASQTGRLLEAAVGNPLEWDQIVPFFGKKELVRGSVYSYYEFESNHPMDDIEWRKTIDSTPRPKWILPFFINNSLTCPLL